MSDYKAFLCISFLTFVLGCLLGLWAGMTANLFRGVSSSPSEATVVNSSAAVRLSLEEHLPSQADVQRELIRRGYDIGDDGVDGKVGTDTRTAWDLAYNQQCAVDIWPK